MKKAFLMCAVLSGCVCTAFSNQDVSEYKAESGAVFVHLPINVRLRSVEQVEGLNQPLTVGGIEMAEADSSRFVVTVSRLSANKESKVDIAIEDKSTQNETFFSFACERCIEGGGNNDIELEREYTIVFLTLDKNLKVGPVYVDNALYGDPLHRFGSDHQLGRDGAGEKIHVKQKVVDDRANALLRKALENYFVDAVNTLAEQDRRFNLGTLCENALLSVHINPPAYDLSQLSKAPLEFPPAYDSITYVAEDPTPLPEIPSEPPPAYSESASRGTTSQAGEFSLRGHWKRFTAILRRTVQRR